MHKGGLCAMEYTSRWNLLNGICLMESARSNLPVESLDRICSMESVDVICSMGSARWNLLDGICSIESARWNLPVESLDRTCLMESADGICSMESVDGICSMQSAGRISRLNLLVGICSMDGICLMESVQWKTLGVALNEGRQTLGIPHPFFLSLDANVSFRCLVPVNDLHD